MLSTKYRIGAMPLGCGTAHVRQSARLADTSVCRGLGRARPLDIDPSMAGAEEAYYLKCFGKPPPQVLRQSSYEYS